jgi:Spy/CpxP family protein refolding chaperone
MKRTAGWHGAVAVAAVAVALAGAVAGLNGPAQAGEGAGAGAGPGDGDKDMSPLKRKERIKTELGIGDDTAVKLFAVLENHRRAMKPLKEELDEIHAAVEEGLAAKTPDEKKIAALLARFETNRKAAEAERWLMSDSVKKILTPSQTARFLLLMEKKLGGGKAAAAASSL